MRSTMTREVAEALAGLVRAGLLTISLPDGTPLSADEVESASPSTRLKLRLVRPRDETQGR